MVDLYFQYQQERSAARADIENEDEEDDQRAQEDQELLEALQENKEQNSGNFKLVTTH